MRGVRQRRPSSYENRQSGARSLAVSEGMGLLLDLDLRFWGKRKTKNEMRNAKSGHPRKDDPTTFATGLVRNGKEHRLKPVLPKERAQPGLAVPRKHGPKTETPREWRGAVLNGIIISG